MSSIMKRVAAIVAIVASTGCEHVSRTAVLPPDQRPSQEYGYVSVADRAGRALTDHLIGVSFSGGGTRAAALAHGVLLALQETNIASPSGESYRFIDEVDLVTAVSGGAVTATNWALKGPDGLSSFREQFLLQNVHWDLIFKKLFNPVTLVRMATPFHARGDLLRDYFDNDLFEHATYRDLLAIPDSSDSPGNSRPYLILNSMDMDRGRTFSFTQEWFDLLCADLGAVKLADAVAASAAYPGFFTAVPLKNHIRSSDCPPDHSQTSLQRVDPLSRMLSDERLRIREMESKAKTGHDDAQETFATSRSRALEAEETEKRTEEEARAARVREATALKARNDGATHESAMISVVKLTQRIEGEAKTALDRASYDEAEERKKLEEAQNELGNRELALSGLQEKGRQIEDEIAEVDKAVTQATVHADELAQLQEEQRQNEGRIAELQEVQTAAAEHADEISRLQEDNRRIEGRIAELRAEQMAAEKRADELARLIEEQGQIEDRIAELDEEAETATTEHADELARLQERSQWIEDRVAELHEETPLAVRVRSMSQQEKNRSLGRLNRDKRLNEEKIAEASKEVGAARKIQQAAKDAHGIAEKHLALRRTQFASAQEARIAAEDEREKARIARSQSDAEYRKATANRRNSENLHEVAVSERETAHAKEREARSAAHLKSQEYDDARQESRSLQGLEDVLEELERVSSAAGISNVDYTVESSATVHLLDGGISDNLGLTPLIELFSLVLEVKAHPEATGLVAQVVNELTVVVVDAGAKSTTAYGSSPSAPGLVDTLKTTVGSSIDSKAFLLRSRLEELKASLKTAGIEVAVIYVGFEEIGKLGDVKGERGVFTKYQACENWFHGIPTNWNLPDREVDNLVHIGGALLRRSVEFRSFLERSDSPVPSGVSVEEVCERALGGA